MRRVSVGISAISKKQIKIMIVCIRAVKKAF
jgi:hypothetical protein